MTMTVAEVATKLKRVPQDLLEDLQSRGEDLQLDSQVELKFVAQTLKKPKVERARQEPAVVDTIEEDRQKAAEQKSKKKEQQKDQQSSSEETKAASTDEAKPVVAEGDKDGKKKLKGKSKPGPAPKDDVDVEADEEARPRGGNARKGAGASPRQNAKRRLVNPADKNRGRGKTGVDGYLDDDVPEEAAGGDGRKLSSRLRAIGSGPRTMVAPKVLVLPTERVQGFERPVERRIREVPVGATNEVSRLARDLAEKLSRVKRELERMGVDIESGADTIDQETAVLLIEELKHKAVVEEPMTAEKLLAGWGSSDVEPVPRPPVITVMGHVDHGKTTLLDRLRKSSLADDEAGGITQSIGAWRVQTDSGELCFIDTPGHEAFSAMRARGAQCTDIVILVVAADDGVMPQTREAVTHAKEAGVPLVVAVNKMDLEAADAEAISRELSNLKVVPESWGGDVQFVNISAKTGEGVDRLLEAVLLQAELLELKAVGEGSAEAVVLESSLDKNRGILVSLLVKSGILCKGDILVVDRIFGRVRSMADEYGKPIDRAGPSQPVSVIGFGGMPMTGMAANVVANEKQVRGLIALREAEQHVAAADAADTDTKAEVIDIEAAFSQFADDEEKRELNVILKADTQGSLEAISDALAKLGDEKHSVRILSGGVGGISESDVRLAADGALLLGFNTRAGGELRKHMESLGVQLLHFSIIYELLEEVEKGVQGLAELKMREAVLGLAEVRKVFSAPQYGQVAGCMVTEGIVRRNSPIRVLRDGVVIFEGKLNSLRRYKEDVTEVRNGTECGIGVRNYQDVRVGDQIESFESLEQPQSESR